MKEQSTTQINILLADDHDLVLQSTKTILEKIDFVNNVFTASFSENIYEFFKSQPIDFLITDISMPQKKGGKLIADEGVKICSWVNNNYPLVKLIVITMADDPEILKRLTELNIKAIISKNEDCSEIALALNTVFAGETFFSKDISNTILTYLPVKKVLPTIQLSDRELFTIQNLAKGLTAKEIAALLKVSTKTIEYHRANLYNLFEAKTAAELVDKCYKSGILKL